MSEANEICLVCMTVNRNIHRPNHVYDWNLFFVSARTYGQVKFFADEVKKKLFLKVLNRSVLRFKVKLFAWVLLENHYHLILMPYDDKEWKNNVEDKNNVKKQMTDFASHQSVTPMPDYSFMPRYILTEFIRKIHKDTSRLINRLDNSPGRKVWYQYWDYNIRNDKDFWTHFNYILKNPYKHKLVDNLEAGFNYKYSSNPQWFVKYSKDGLYECLYKYPVKEIIWDE